MKCNSCSNTSNHGIRMSCLENEIELKDTFKKCNLINLSSDQCLQKTGRLGSVSQRMCKCFYK